MFVARVSVGRYIELPYSNETTLLTQPPLLPSSKVDRYDSVKGNTQNTNVYMVYYNQ